MTSSRTPSAQPQAALVARRYRIDATLGQGGMGAVYAATDLTTGKRLALKRAFATASPRVLELFKREFHTLHGLRHPNIIEVFDYGVDTGGPYYTMELLEGGDLGAAAPLPWPRVCSYVRQAATTLGLLHARRLLHRDVTPRNLWLLPDGRIKLIDFGALCPFGLPTEVVGTPPFIAPEWLLTGDARVFVDQRADLYALGALAYWLLTSVHAYPARTVADLPRTWAREPAPASSLSKLAKSRDLPPIPPELDALIASLLRKDPAARPRNTERVIDLIDTIAGPPADALDQAPKGYVQSKLFVGRDAALTEIAKHVAAARDHGSAITVQGPHGIGRSRLLEEAHIRCRLAGVTAVLARSDDPERAYGLANAIALALLDSVPAARSCANPHAGRLAQLSDEVRQRLGVAEHVSREATPRGREQLQTALTEWLFAVSAEQPLVVFIDDLDCSDEESEAWLAALAMQCGARRLVLVAVLLVEPNVEPALAVQIFRRAGHVVELSPLSAGDVLRLLESVFGSVAYVGRVSETLFRVCDGNPAHCLELVEFLIDRGIARYTEGSWFLPGQLSESELPQSRGDIHAARLAQLGQHARQLAEVMSIHAGRWTTASCNAVSELDAHDTAAALVELNLSGVLDESEQGHGFAHPSVRLQLSAALDERRRLRAHERLGESLVAQAADPIDALHAAAHLFHAGAAQRCDDLVRAACQHLFEGHRARMHLAVPLLEEIVALYRAAHQELAILSRPLAALATASFFVDRRLADRYGQPAVDALEHVLRFDLARRLRPKLGAKLALYSALAAATARRDPRGPDVKDALRMLAGTVVGLNAVATSGFDLKLAERCRLALEPLEAFSDRNAVGFIRRCTLAVAAMLSANHAAALSELRQLGAMLSAGASKSPLPAHLHQEFLGGCLFSIGIMESWRLDPATLEIAARIEPFSPTYALNADHLRALYYAGHGEMARAEYYRRRVETRALQMGAAWQVVTLGPIESQLSALWTHDAELAKRASAELERLSRELPSLRHEARRARATYLVLCDRAREVIETMRSDDAPKTLAGWARGQGLLARAHNRLGDHARARELCQLALAGCSEEDLSFVVMTLHVQLECAIAEAALGDGVQAHARLDKLFARHRDTAGPLAVGALHETRVRLALIEGDVEAGRRSWLDMRACYERTGIPTLLDVIAELGNRLTFVEHGPAPASLPADSVRVDDEHLMTRLHLILTHSQSFEDRAHHGLHVALQLTGAEDGFIVSTAEIVTLGDEAPPSDLVRWARGQLTADAELQTAVAVPDQIDSQFEARFGELSYIVVPLSGAAEQPESQVAIALGFRGKSPTVPSRHVLEILARHLVEPSG